MALTTVKIQRKKNGSVKQAKAIHDPLHMTDRMVATQEAEADTIPMSTVIIPGTVVSEVETVVSLQSTAAAAAAAARDALMRVTTPPRSPAAGTRVLLDRVRAGFIGLALGDALGVPHEFGRAKEYTGQLYLANKMTSQWQAARTMGIGQISDDTEMAITLARSLIEGQGWHEEIVANGYMEWANSKSPWLGKQTRALFVGLTTYPGFLKRYTKLCGTTPTAAREMLAAGQAGPGENMQSNGSLMRCFPLACMWNLEVGGDDAALTNPSSVNYRVGIYYVNLIRLALTGATAADVWTQAVASADHPSIVMAVEAVSAGEVWTLADTKEKKAKGWVINSLYAGLACLYAMAVNPAITYGELMRWVIGDHPKSDTDTNAAIAGSLIGALMGWDRLLAEEQANIDIMLNMTETEIPRPPQYGLGDMEEICQALTHLSSL